MLASPVQKAKISMLNPAARARHPKTVKSLDIVTSPCKKCCSLLLLEIIPLQDRENAGRATPRSSHHRELETSNRNCSLLDLPLLPCHQKQNPFIELLLHPLQRSPCVSVICAIKTAPRGGRHGAKKSADPGKVVAQLKALGAFLHLSRLLFRSGSRVEVGATR